MALSSYKYALIAPRLEKIMAQNASPKVQEWQSYGKSRKVTLNTHFSEKQERGDQGKFFKNRQKSSPCLKGPKALWRKLNYTLIKMHLKCKDGKYIGANSGSKSVRMGKLWQLSQGHPKPAFFWKSAKGRPREVFQKSPKKKPSLKILKSTLAEITLSSK